MTDKRTRERQMRHDAHALVAAHSILPRYQCLMGNGTHASDLDLLSSYATLEPRVRERENFGINYTKYSCIKDMLGPENIEMSFIQY